MLTAAALLLTGLGMWCYDKKLSPLVEQAAVYAVTDGVLLLIHRALEEEIASDELDYDRLVTVERDSSGSVTAIVTNAGRTNLLQARITERIIESVDSNDLSDLRIPLGNVFAGSLLYGRGPSVRVRLKSVNNISVNFENSFSEAGINQTRHQIRLNVSVQVLVLIPGKELTAPVSTSVVIAETVIVGPVPQTYAPIGQ